jgi:pimeloyl-ACP methyl ester carboxylesterase
VARVVLRALSHIVRRSTVTGTRSAARVFPEGTTVPWRGKRVQSGRPLIVVGGYASIPELYAMLARSYRAAGVADVRMAPLLDHAFCDINDNAVELQRFLRRVTGPFDLVGHSEGGLIARAFVRHHGGDGRVAHMVTLGTPHRGLPHAWHAQHVFSRAPALARTHVDRLLTSQLGALLGQISMVAIQQMLEGSEFLRLLDEDGPTPEPTRFLAIASRHDGVVPYASASLPHADNVANVTIDDGWLRGNHLSIASTNQRSFAATLQFLGRRHPLDD